MVGKIGFWSLIVALAAGPAVAANEPPALPNGASSVQETYDDWQVLCLQAEATIRCSMSQQQAQQDGQRVLAIELGAGDSGITGSLVLPFGLALAAGATLQIDDGQAQAPLPFKTCLPGGCIVPVSFGPEMLDRLAKGTLLKVTVTAADNDQPAVLNISLKGIAAALDRVMALSR
jgi:invasion protein IalB